MHAAHIEQVFVPCEHNAHAFAVAGLHVSVVPGGTDPDEFPLITESAERPYTFLTFADRGARKGWVETHDAFYKAFGSPDDTPDVRLIVKGRGSLEHRFLEAVAEANRDPRLRFWLEDVAHPSEVYREADCLVLPSRSEGWGMPHREAAMMGLPVIVGRHSGLDDGHTDEWALVLQTTHEAPIPSHETTVAGTWRKADVPELATWLRWCYENPVTGVTRGQTAAQWLRQNQTWQHAAQRFVEVAPWQG
jgi:glycosyltransferase involved in cell wall biosynthesis